MKVLILGGGYIGTHLHKHLKGRYDVTQITKTLVDYTHTDPTRPDFRSWLHDNRFDVAVNCSGYTGRPNVDACEDDKEKCWQYNAVSPAATAYTLNMARTPVIHLSSGCIYQGSNMWTEDDTPNFGVFEDDSSFYSKSKHAGEMALLNLGGYILRLRMPFCDTYQDKNILKKYLKYDNIVSIENSLTCITDLCFVIEHFCNHRDTIPYGIYNVVNKGTADAEYILDKMKEVGLENPNWEITSLDDLNLKAGRSNCTLSGDKLDRYYNMPHVTESLKQSIIRLSKFKKRNPELWQDTEKV